MRSVVGSAQVAERIEEILCLFDSGYYDAEPLYPKQWRNLAHNLIKRKTPKYYAGIITLMALCVIIAMWLTL